ncbi:uncharacterized protein PpBr36_09444 [Pyricularia pennisetigena]|uniref:uncharacterized protein n=1 Tax=Pyricularia pennisetigena TaxID=1578925 RepID=UPI001151C4BF|nr:uncharacterized protein PpBr36_09444 [Pyricularia pennisetigena]TLS21755.1 hypothetical protein PpBr36_09444 [Pyricularia pennisetigena]
MASSSSYPRSFVLPTTEDQTTRRFPRSKPLSSIDETPTVPLEDMRGSLGVSRCREADLNGTTFREVECMIVELTAKAEQEESEHKKIVERIASYEKAMEILTFYMIWDNLSNSSEPHTSKFKTMAKKLSKALNNEPTALLHAWDVLFDAGALGPAVVLPLPGCSRSQVYRELAALCAECLGHLGAEAARKVFGRPGTVKGEQQQPARGNNKAKPSDLNSTVNVCTDVSCFNTFQVFYYRERDGLGNMHGTKATSAQGRELFNEWVRIRNRLLYQERPAAAKAAALHREALYLLETRGPAAVEELEETRKMPEVLGVLKKML